MCRKGIVSANPKWADGRGGIKCDLGNLHLRGGDPLSQDKVSHTLHAHRRSTKSENRGGRKVKESRI